MTEREDNVYRAKLAEQAERYDGKAAIITILPDKCDRLFFPSRPRLGGRSNLGRQGAVRDKTLSVPLPDPGACDNGYRGCVYGVEMGVCAWVDMGVGGWA